jgi:GDP-4-dehydro-6-deoxy-D-mannose reductase
MSSYPDRFERHFERVLITGASGFTGQYLVDHVHSTASSIRLFGFDLVPKAIPHCEMLEGDITRREDVDRVVKHVEPDCVIHLASIFDHPDYQRVYHVNVIGTLHLLEALRAFQPPTRPIVLIVCSSAEYGAVLGNELPITEETSLRPLDHYGASKATQDLIGLQYYLYWRLAVMRARPFNLVGPGQPSILLCGSLVEQIIAIERGQRSPVLSLGNLSPRRDFVDVRDAVRAYWSIVTAGKLGEAYNISSGQAHSVQDVLDILLELSGVKVQIQQKDTRKRKGDVPIQVGDNTKLQEATGWRPRLTLRDSLKDMLQYVRNEKRS